jgi:hypothetical protein
MEGAGCKKGLAALVLLNLFLNPLSEFFTSRSMLCASSNRRLKNACCSVGGFD